MPGRLRAGRRADPDAALGRYLDAPLDRPGRAAPEGSTTCKLPRRPGASCSPSRNVAAEQVPVARVGAPAPLERVADGAAAPRAPSRPRCRRPVVLHDRARSTQRGRRARRAARLPLHPTGPKNWDALGACGTIVATSAPHAPGCWTRAAPGTPRSFRGCGSTASRPDRHQPGVRPRRPRTVSGSATATSPDTVPRRVARRRDLHVGHRARRAGRRVPRRERRGSCAPAACSSSRPTTTSHRRTPRATPPTACR